MHDYWTLLNQNAQMPDVRIIQQDIEAADQWDDVYWIGRYVYEQASGEADRLIMSAYEKAFVLGLNIHVNREHFLTATQQIARVYFQFRKYDEAINKLMILESNVGELPDWVNLYYVSAQIHTKNVLYWAEVPGTFFGRIDRINESDPESVKRRKYLYLEFMNRICELSRTADVSNVDRDAILKKAAELGLEGTRECTDLKAALGIGPALPEWPHEPEVGTGEGTTVNGTAVYEKLIADLRKRLSELQAIIDKQALSLEQAKKLIDDQKRTIAILLDEKKTIENESSRIAKELKSAKESEYSAQARCVALESQISGNETTKTQLEENASVIGELRADVEDLKTALTVTLRSNEKLRLDIKQRDETIEELENEIRRIQETVQELHATVEAQKLQLEIAEAAVKTAEEKAGSVEARPGSDEPSEEPAAGPDQLTLLDILTVENFLTRRQKILVIGGSETKEKHLRGKLKSMGFDFAKDQLEFELEYDNVKDYASRIKRWSGKYAGIIVGPCPHKAKDIDGYSSFIEQLKSEEGYPHVEEARDKAGALKISNTSIGEAMMKMAVYLCSIA